MFNRFIKLNLALFILLFIFAQVNTVFADTEKRENSIKLTITDLTIQPEGDGTVVFITTNAKRSDITTNEIPGTDKAPARMYIDFNGATIAGAKNEYFVGSVLDKIRTATNDNGVRIVFDSATSTLFDFDINEAEDGLRLTFKDAGSMNKEQATSSEDDNTLNELIDSSVAEIGNKAMEANVSQDEKKVEDSFNISGFKKERISVDFYKIDLHNVFRLFKEISGLNIIVDEKVDGTLTLSLDDVPWDFALDIILNLSDLRKEERFNTIVIYPKEKEFTWPERTSVDNLEIETDIDVLEKETLIVQQSANQPKEIMEAQEIIKKAKMAEKNHDYEDAAKHYEKALLLWPDNKRISNRLATLYLVELRMNAKALYYAKQSLKYDPENYKAALYAAIGSANMHNRVEAMEFFNQSVSGNPPLKEALISYAAFSENNNDFDGALRLLQKHEDYYGETSNTILSKARIYDKKGDSKNAVKQYRALLSSGFQLRADLRKYVQERLAAENM